MGGGWEGQVGKKGWCGGVVKQYNRTEDSSMMKTERVAIFAIFLKSHHPRSHETQNPPRFILKNNSRSEKGRYTLTIFEKMNTWSWERKIGFKTERKK